nr:hypothetical protein CFP56_57096 [Quercus suber]
MRGDDDGDVSCGDNDGDVTVVRGFGLLQKGLREARWDQANCNWWEENPAKDRVDVRVVRIMWPNIM